MSVHSTYAPHLSLLVVLATGAFTTTLNLTLLSPLLPHIAADFGVPEATAGQLGTLTAVTAGMVAILAAPLIDRYARRTVLQVEAALLFVSTLCAVVAPTFAMLAVSRMLAGAGGAIILGVCVAATADLIPDPARRNRSVGLLTTACALGTIAGLPLLTQIASLSNWRAAIGVLLPLSLVMFAGVTRLPDGAPQSLDRSRPRWTERYHIILTSPVTVALLTLAMFQSGIRLGWLIYIGAFAQARFGMSAAALAALFVAGGAAEILANSFGPRL